MEYDEALEAICEHLTLFEETSDQVTNIFQEIDEVMEQRFLDVWNEVTEAEDLLLEELRVYSSEQHKPNSLIEAELIRHRNTIKFILSGYAPMSIKRTQRPIPSFSLLYNPGNLAYVTRHVTKPKRLDFTKIEFAAPTVLNLPFDANEIQGLICSGYKNITRLPNTIKLPYLRFEGSVLFGPKTISLGHIWGFAEHPKTKNLYFSDDRSSHILEFSPGFRLMRLIGNHGDGLSEFKQPRGIAFSLDGQLFVVVDNANDRIKLYDESLNLLRVIDNQVCQREVFEYPQDVAFDRFGDFYVAGGATNTILKFNRGGELVWKYSGEEGGQPEMDWTWAVCVSENDEIYASCTGGKVFILSLEGKFLRFWGIPFPVGDFGRITRGPNGTMVVSCYESSKVTFIDEDGQAVHSIPAKKPVGIGFTTEQKFIVTSFGGAIWVF